MSTELAEPPFEDIFGCLIQEYGTYERALREMCYLAGYVDVPPTIDEFLFEDEFCGDFFGDDQLWSPWVEVLRQVFPNQLTSPFIEIAATGAIGIGKTELCSAGILYDICKMLYLKNPQRIFGLGKHSAIVIAFINTTQTLAEAVLYRRASGYMFDSPFFLRQMDSVKSHKKHKVKDLLPHHINILNASRGRQQLGQDVVAGVLSELNFQGEIVKNQAVENYSQLKSRIESRFGRGRGMIVPGRVWLDSSRKDETGYLENHLKNLQDTNQKDREDGRDPTNLIVCKSIWEMKQSVNPNIYCGEKFYVFVGDRTKEPKILDGPKSSLGLSPSLIIPVPIEFRPYFERNLVASIRDLAGVATFGSFRYMSQESKVRSALRLQNCLKDAPTVMPDEPLSSEVIRLDFEDEDDQIIKYIDMDRLIEAISKPKDADGNPTGFYNCFIHYDLGYADRGDNTGIALTCCLGQVTVERYGEHLKNNMTHDLLFRTPLVISIGARPGSEVPISKMRVLLINLLERRIPIVGVSADGFQSAEIIQLGTKLHLKSEIISTVRTRDPYDLLRDTITEGRWSGPIHYILCEELLALREEKGKIDHPQVTDALALQKPSKDVSDACAGSIFHCKMHTADAVHVSTAYSEYTSYLKRAKTQVETERQSLQSIMKREHDRKKYFGR